MTEQKKRPEQEEKQDRRQFFMQGLSAAAGLAVGFSVIKEAWGQVKVQPKDLQVQPNLTKIKPRIPENFKVDFQRKRQLAEQVAPTLENILNDAGVKLSPEEMSGLKQGLIERGTIRIPGGPGSQADNTVNVTSTVTYD